MNERIAVVDLHQRLAGQQLRAGVLPGHLPLPGRVGQARHRDPHGWSGDVRHAGEFDLRLRHQALLVAIDAPYLKLISFIAVIASTVQLVEMFIKKVSPALFRALGIFLPLITTNCAILGLALFQTNKGYSFVQCIVYALGAGAGFTLALVLMAGLREKLELADVPDVTKGTAMALMLAGLLSVTFMGFGGLGG